MTTNVAKHGTTSESNLKCPIPQSYIKRLIDDKVTRMNQETWLTDGPRHTKLTLGHKHANIIKNLNTTLSNNRQNYRTAVHLITGHCGLNKHLHTIWKSNTNGCPMWCDGEDTVSHFLGQCPLLPKLLLNKRPIFPGLQPLCQWHIRQPTHHHDCQIRKPNQTPNCAGRVGSDWSGLEY